MKRLDGAITACGNWIAIIAVLCLVFAARNAITAEKPQTPAPKEQAEKSQKKTIPAQDMEKICVDFARLGEERLDLERKKNHLLDQITDAKARLDSEVSPIKRNFTRREIDKLATQWYDLIEKSQAIEDQQRNLAKQMLESREQFEAYLRKTVASIRKQIESLSATPEQRDERLPRLEKRLERIDLILELLNRLKDSPELLEEILAAPPEPGPPPERLPPGEPGELRETPIRLRLRVMRLEKEIQFLRSRLERYDQELQTIKNALRTGPEEPNAPQ
jgi:predicted  nucleic acid-binding Zn-ribbon protein